MQLEAVKLTAKINECNDKCKSFITILDQAREQRAKRNEQEKINFTKIIRDLDEINYQKRIGEHGHLLEKSLKRKKKEMIEQGLIMTADSVVQEEHTIEQTVSKNEETKDSEAQKETPSS
jgi:hypothetical protein